jgi:hypothetical protein
LKEAQPENTEVAPRVNGTTPNLEASFEPDEYQITILDHPPKGTVEDVTGWLKWYSDEQSIAIGTLSEPPRKKGKQQVPRSPHKQPVPTLVLSHIPNGVRVEEGFLGHIDKFKYSYHDLADPESFQNLQREYT